MWVLIGFSVILAALLISLAYDDSKFFILMTAALCLRLLIIVTFSEITGADLSDYLPYFKQFSTLLATENLFHAVTTFVDTHVPFYTILYPGYIYTIYGESGILLIRIINVCLSIAILPVLNGINKLVFNREFAHWQAGLILFWPSFAFFSVEVGRTVPSVLLVLMSTYFFLRILVSFSRVNLGIFLMISGALTMMRVYYFIYPLSLLSVLIGYNSLRNRNNKLVPVLSGIVGSTAVLLGISAFPYSFTLQRINSLARGIAHGDSAYLTTVYPGSMLDLLWYVPIQGIYFQFSPFIWDVIRIGGLLTIIAFLQASIVIILLISALNARTSSIINGRFIIVSLALLVVTLAVGIGVKNTGSAMRWRLPTELLLITLTSTIVHHRYISND